MPGSSDSDSSSEDEKVKQLLEAADFTLINDNLFNKDETKATAPVATPKSQRYLESESTDVKSDIFVPLTMQKFIANRMSELISKSVKFVETSESTEPAVNDPPGGVRLLSDASDYIKDEEPAETLLQPKPPAWKSRKHKLEDALNTTNPKSVAIDVDCLLSKAETKIWTNRKGAETYHYKAKKGNLYLVEPETEFTAARKKNNWDESKIRSSS